MVKLLLSWILAFELVVSRCFQPVLLRNVHCRKKHGDIFKSRLFPMNFDGNGGVTTEDVEQKDAEAQKDSDIAAFFQGLGQWPLYPSSTDTSVEGRSNELEKLKSDEESVYPRRLYRESNPLSNLIKLEVILDLADGVKVNETEQYFSSILSITDQLFKASKASQASEGALNISSSNAIRVGDLLQRDKWGDPIQSLTSLFESTAVDETLAKTSLRNEGSIVTDTSSSSIGQTAEAMVRVATSRLENILNEASKGLSPNIANDLVLRAVNVFANGTTSVEQLASDIVSVAQKTAKAQGLDAQYATERAKDATRGVSTIVNVANRVFNSGYAYGSASGVAGKPYVTESETGELPLFADYDTAGRVEQFQYDSVVASGGVMGILSGAVYENPIDRSHQVGHSLVANGTTADVAWMVTDSVHPASMFKDPLATNSGSDDSDDMVFVRSITLRGFDASDDTVDRERLLNNILKAAETRIDKDVPDVLLHSGLLGLASEIYDELKKYIEWASPDHKILINGHSIGGSLSVLLLFLITVDKGVEFVEDRILRVFSFGSPPIARLSKADPNPNEGTCGVLKAFGLPTNIVFGYVQPYDPIVRLFTQHDPLYPLVDDLGPDETTLYYSGPARSLRPIARALFQAWEGWPEFRESWKGANQEYQSVGVQYILLPEPLRYLNDRFFATNMGVPEVDAIVQISSSELLPALNNTFPLDVFQISLVPQATRSFLHHFFPAYDSTMENFATKVKKEMKERL